MTRKKEEQIQDMSEGVQQTAEDFASDPNLKVHQTEEATVEVSTERIESMEENPVTSCIYLGPNLPGGRLLQSTVFRGGIPEYLKPLLEEIPDVAELIVPIKIISEVQGRISKTGTAEYVAYQAILKGVN